MTSEKKHRVQFFNVESEEEFGPETFGTPMYSTWSLWTSFLRNVNRLVPAAADPLETETIAMFHELGTPTEKISKVNFTESPRVEEVVLPLDWAEYLIFKERMHRRRSTGSHIIRGIKRIRIKRLRSETNSKPYRSISSLLGQIYS
jgi:hypothetical protein